MFSSPSARQSYDSRSTITRQSRDGRATITRRNSRSTITWWSRDSRLTVVHAITLEFIASQWVTYQQWSPVLINVITVWLYHLPTATGVPMGLWTRVPICYGLSLTSLVLCEIGLSIYWAHKMNTTNVQSTYTPTYNQHATNIQPTYNQQATNIQLLLLLLYWYCIYAFLANCRKGACGYVQCWKSSVLSSFLNNQHTTNIQPLYIQHTTNIYNQHTINIHSTYNQHTINIQSTYTQHTTNIQSTYKQ